MGAHRQNNNSVTRPHKAPDEAKEKPDKTIDDIVAMVSLTRDKDGAVFSSETETSSDLETEGEKHDGVNPPVLLCIVLHIFTSI